MQKKAQKTKRRKKLPLYTQNFEIQETAEITSQYIFKISKLTP